MGGRLGEKELFRQLGISPDQPGSVLVLKLYHLLVKLGAVDALTGVAIIRFFNSQLLDICAQIEAEVIKTEPALIIADGRYISLAGDPNCKILDAEEGTEAENFSKPLLLTAISLKELNLRG